VDLLVCGLVFDPICHIFSSGNNFFTLSLECLGFEVTIGITQLVNLAPKAPMKLDKFANNNGDNE
jgi:hypothetical protein